MRQRNLAILFVVIIYSVGFIGLSSEAYRGYFLPLTPLNLLLTTTILLSFHNDWSFSFILFSLVCALIGFAAEVIGVKTSVIFGTYSYGQTLGFKWMGVPLIIAINWLLLVYICGNLTAALRIHWFMKAMLSASCMILLDYAIEPVAVCLDFGVGKTISSHYTILLDGLLSDCSYSFITTSGHSTKPTKWPCQY